MDLDDVPLRDLSPVLQRNVIIFSPQERSGDFSGVQCIPKAWMMIELFSVRIFATCDFYKEECSPIRSIHCQLDHLFSDLLR